MAILTLVELNQLRASLVAVFAHLHELQKQTPMARYIKAPQIPSAFSESLAIHLLKNGSIIPELQGAAFTIGEEADIVARKDAATFKIEVKATGNRGFQRLGPKDLAADYLIWMHFDLFFRDEAGKPIFVWTVKQPGRFFTSSGIIQLATFQSKVGSELKAHSIMFDALQDPSYG